MKAWPGHWRGALAGMLLLGGWTPAWGVRPFITDDARVVGHRQAQMESWVRGDRHRFEHWLLTAYGPIAPVELTIGTVQGVSYEDGRQYSLAGPLLQGKYLLRPWKQNSWPGVAVVAGAFAPSGLGELRPANWEPFGYVAITQSFGEGDQVQIHGNGGFVQHSGGRKPTWGLGSQIRVRGGFHTVSEVFSGDPYAESSGTAFQAGFRHFFSEYIQVDATIGTGLTGQPSLPVWATIGVRLVTPPLGRKVFSRLRGR